MKTIQTLMKAISVLLLSMLALSAYAAGDEQQVDVPAFDVVSWSADGLTPMTVMHEGKTFQCQLRHQKKASEEEHEFTWQEVTTTRGGELADLLGDKLKEVDSLVVNGPINDADFRTLWSASLNDHLSVINLENAAIENNAIPDNAFYHPDEQYVGDYKEHFYYIRLNRIILPEGLEKIGNKAFAEALVLEEVNLPSTLRELGDYVFNSTRIKMDPLVIPEGVETIGVGAFAYCDQLAGEVVLPSTMKEILFGAFCQAPITSINLPEGLEKIEGNVFQRSHLKEVAIPNSCLNFGNGNMGWNFADNYYLEKMQLPEGMTEIPAGFLENASELCEVNIPHTVKHIGLAAFAHCTSLKSLELPLGVQSLDEEALRFMSSLERIVFPASMKSLGAQSCAYWKSIKEVYCAATEPPVCETKDGGPFAGYGFTEGTQTPIVYIPTGTMDKYFDSSQNGAGWGGFWNFVEIDPSEFPVTAIGTPAITDNRADKADNVIYDLQGRRVENPQKGHIYVSKGKKFVFGR